MLLISLIETADSSLILTASVHDASLEAEGYIKLPLPTANPARTLVLRGSIITHLPYLLRNCFQRKFAETKARKLNLQKPLLCN